MDVKIPRMNSEKALISFRKKSLKIEKNLHLIFSGFGKKYEGQEISEI